MKQLSRHDINKYLEFGQFNNRFLDKNYLCNALNINDETAITTDTIKLLLTFVHNNIHSSKDINFNRANKFRRNAQQIWESGVATGCTDYAIVFSNLAKHIGIPSTILHTADFEYAKQLCENAEKPRRLGHSFCECFLNGKWILVDPTKQIIEEKYNTEKIELSYMVGGKNVFLPYVRKAEFLPETQKEHCAFMDIECIKIFNNSKSTKYEKK